MRRVWFALAAAAAGLTLGAASPKADETSADERQEQQIRAALEKAPALKDNHINVDVDDGIASLAGTVDSQREKQQATQLAHVEGVLGVNNRLVIRPGN